MLVRLFAMVVAVVFVSACGVESSASVDEVSGEDLTADEYEVAVTTGRFETFQGKNGQYYFHLLAGNGEKVLSSEGYTTFAASQDGILSVQANGTSATRFDLREASDGSWFFQLTATNGQPIGTSEMYVSQSNAKRAINSVINVVKATKLNGPANQGAIRFEVFKGLDAKYYFHLRAQNGQIVLRSQGYGTKSAANDGVAAVKTNGTNVTRYDLRDSADGRYYFVLRSSNAKVIGVSELYETSTAAGNGITVVMNLLGGNR